MSNKSIYEAVKNLADRSQEIKKENSTDFTLSLLSGDVRVRAYLANTYQIELLVTFKGTVVHKDHVKEQCDVDAMAEMFSHIMSKSFGRTGQVVAENRAEFKKLIDDNNCNTALPEINEAAERLTNPTRIYKTERVTQSCSVVLACWDKRRGDSDEDVEYIVWDYNHAIKDFSLGSYRKSYNEAESIYNQRIKEMKSE